MALPENGISIPMVARELGTTENDLGRLCAHANINKWAKYKPVRFESVERLTDAQRVSVRMGFAIPNEQNANVATLSSNWAYSKPRGGEAEPFRLIDFGGYNKDAGIPFNITFPEPFMAGTFNPNVGNVKLISNNADISLDDLFEGMYFGVMLFPDNASGERYFKTADEPNVYTLSIKDSPHTIQGNNLKLYPFMASSNIPQWEKTPFTIMESLNAEENIAIGEVNVIGAQMPNKETVTVTGINVRGYSETVDGYVTAQLLTNLTKNYNASTVTVTARRNSDNALVYTKVYPAGVNVSPEYIDRYDYSSGDVIGFTVNTSFFPIDTTLPPLAWNDYYNIRYEIKYI